MRADEYGFEVVVAAALPEAEARLRTLLAEEGFGVLTEIDVRRTLKEKLGADFPPYRILGACNPKLAQRALEAEPAVGLLLPCNVVVEEAAGGTRIRLLNPKALFGAEAGVLGEVATEAEERLRRVAARLAGSST